MLTQADADRLMAMIKHFEDRSPIRFPIPGHMAQFNVKSEDGHESFIIDVNRRGRIKVTKCTDQERYRIVEILLRLDINGPTHENPDGTEVPTPHLHIYREGYAAKWAYPLPVGKFTDPLDLVNTFRDFLRYCNVRDIPEIQHAIS